MAVQAINKAPLEQIEGASALSQRRPLLEPTGVLIFFSHLIRDRLRLVRSLKMPPSLRRGEPYVA